MDHSKAISGIVHRFFYYALLVHASLKTAPTGSKGEPAFKTGLKIGKKGKKTPVLRVPNTDRNREKILSLQK
ncbi:MAG: hypothetical protein ACYCT9_09705 [Leptospirillum sp.]